MSKTKDMLNNGCVKAPSWLQKIMDNLAQSSSFDFSMHNTLGLAPAVKELRLISCPDTLVEALQNKPGAVVGELSNTLVGERIEEPLVLFRDGEVSKITSDGTHYLIHVQGSCALDKLVTHLIGQGIAGMELLSGIPGTVGAGVVQNVGAYGAQISTYFDSARIFNVATGEQSILQSQGFDFQYRSSSLKHVVDADKQIVLDAVFRIPLNNPASALVYDGLKEQHAVTERSDTNLDDIRQTVLDVRSTKGMVVNCTQWTPCVGSYFISPIVDESIARNIAATIRGEDFADEFLKWYRPDGKNVRVPAALVLRAAGFLNGDTWGNVGLSERHILALTAQKGATGSDMANLATYIKQVVREKLGITLEQEILPLGEFEDLGVEDFFSKNPHVPGQEEPEWVREGLRKT